MNANPDAKRIGILIVAYNAAATLAKVLDRIPRDFLPRVSEILVCDNASEDETYLVGLGYKQLAGRTVPLQIIRQPHNRGYGGNQKTGYEWAIENDLDIVVLLHADGQYAPEFLPEIVGPLERGECDAVFGSRMMTPGGARQGGMPLYKVLGNKVLTAFENRVAGTQLSEWHSGYRAYSVATLRDIPFQRNSDDYDFDSQIILQLHEAGKRIVELPIPTFYGEEVSYVNGMRYARDIVTAVLRYRAHKLGLGSGETAFETSPYDHKARDTASGRLLTWLSGRPPMRVLLVGADGPEGAVAAELHARGHDVVAVEPDGPLPAGPFGVILAIDALDRTRRAGELLGAMGDRLAPGGTVLVEVANFGHWYPRAKVAAGRFGYERDGAFDERTVRFYTRDGVERLFASEGFAVRRREAVGLPFEPAAGAAPRGAGPWVEAAGLALRPTLFAYRFLYEVAPDSGT